MVAMIFGLNENYKELGFEHRLLHNTRKHKVVKNSIFERTENFDYVCDKIKKLTKTKEIKNFFETEEEKIKEVVKTKTGRKSQMKNHLMESLITISNEDYERYGHEQITETIKEYLKKLENEYKIKIYSYSVHYDEGHFIENNTKVRNVHCHFIHSNISYETGKSFTRQIYMKGEKNDYSFIQNHIQDFFIKKLPTLKLQQKNRKQRTVNYKDWKQIKQQEQKIIQKHKKQVENIKQKAISELKKQQEQLRQKDNEIVYLKKENVKLQKEIYDLKEKLKHITTQSQQHQIQRKIQNLEKNIDNYGGMEL